MNEDQKFIQANDKDKDNPMEIELAQKVNMVSSNDQYGSRGDQKMDIIKQGDINLKQEPGSPGDGQLSQFLKPKHKQAIAQLQPKERVKMSNFEELKQAEKGGSVKRFIMWQIAIFIICVIFIFITFDYRKENIFIFLSNGLNGVLFGLMQSQALEILAYVKCENVPPEDRENFNLAYFNKYNKYLRLGIVVACVSLSLVFGKLVWEELIPHYAICIFAYYWILLFSCYLITVMFYSYFLAITEAQKQHIQELENAKDFIIPGIDPHCYKNFQKDYTKRQAWVETALKKRGTGNLVSQQTDLKNIGGESSKDYYEEEIFNNPMITRDNLFGVFMHLATNLGALCAAYYFEHVYIEFENSGDYTSIVGFILYPGIAMISKKISGNVLIKQMNMNNHVKSINFMAMGYRLAFIRMDNKMRNILIVTKYSWKIINFLAFPLFLKGIVEKIKKAFYEGETKKTVTKDLEQYQNYEKNYKEKFTYKFLLMQVKEMVFDASFMFAGVVFWYIIRDDSSFLFNIFEDRGFEEYQFYFGMDIIAEFVILLIVTITLKYNGFFTSFSSLLNQLQIKIHSKYGLIQDLYDGLFAFSLSIFLLENKIQI